MEEKHLYELPVWWLPSFLVVAKEYVLAENKLEKCPKCGSTNITFVSQRTLKPEPGWPYPIGGDVLVYQCMSCGYKFEFTFKFRKPTPQDNVFDDFLLVYKHLLTNCSTGTVPDYATFQRELSLILLDLK